MQKFFKMLGLMMSLVLLFAGPNLLMAQPGGHGGGMGGHGGGGMGGHGGNGGGMGGGNCNPDSLVPITVSGTAIVDTSMMYPMYFLDEDGDGNADYMLNFGPHWYTPDSSNATRPQDGENITIDGGLMTPPAGGNVLPMVVVYQINGLFWRDPYIPFWGGGHGGHGGHGGGGHGGHGGHGGWMNDTLTVVSVTGTALVDTTFMFNHYYLDEDQDGQPDYFLNFGPPWYQPASGATRPNDGDNIDIVGGLVDHDSTLDVIIVYEINGLVWRDSSAIGPHFGGQWIHRQMTQSRYVHTPWDSLSGMHIHAGWHGGHGGGGQHGNMPDSIFCQMGQLFPQNMPSGTHQTAFVGYEIGMYDPAGMNLFFNNPNGNGHMMFNNQANISLHYMDVLIQGNQIDENSLQVEKYDPAIGTWQVVGNATLNTAENTISFQTSDLTAYYAITGQTTALEIGGENNGLITDFDLYQNYPNPFNPTTTIAFNLNKNSQVVLSIYNVIGQKVAELVNGELQAGVHEYQFDASTFSSGIYFYELKAGEQQQIRKMNLIK